jgi:hypothetical protein
MKLKFSVMTIYKALTNPNFMKLKVSEKCIYQAITNDLLFQLNETEWLSHANLLRKKLTLER